MKAAGGIRTAAQFAEMVDAGANRIGASASVAIVRELGAPGRVMHGRFAVMPNMVEPTRSLHGDCMGRLTGVLGILAILLFAYLFSTEPKSHPHQDRRYRTVLQFVFAVLVLRVGWACE